MSTLPPGVRIGLTLAARAVLGVVFALSAISKIVDTAAFRDSVAAYHILPTGLITPFAYVLPWIEALIALYFLVGLFLRPTAVVAAILLVVFMIALGISLAQGNTGHGCGCFSGSSGLASFPPVVLLSGGSTITPFDLVRDLVFLILAGIVYWGNRGVCSVDGFLFGTMDENDDSDTSRLGTETEIIR